VGRKVPKTFWGRERNLNLLINEQEFVGRSSRSIAPIPAELSLFSCACTYVYLRAYECMGTVVSVDNGYFSDVGIVYAIWQASSHILSRIMETLRQLLELATLRICLRSFTYAT
jgi:hypothetical protein